MKQLKGYFEGRVNDLLRKATVFDQRLISDREKMGAIQMKLIGVKSTDPEKGFQKAKSDLKDFQEAGFFALLLEQNMGIVYSAIKEIHTMDTTLDLGLEIEDQYKERYNQVGASPSELFTVNKEGQAELVEGEMATQIKSDLNNRALSDEVLKTIYDTIPVNEG